jgi:hypothetical protein
MGAECVHEIGRQVSQAGPQVKEPLTTEKEPATLD